MNETIGITQAERSFWQQIWDFIVAPLNSAYRAEEQRTARLAATFLFIILSLEIIGVLVRFAVLGISIVDVFSGGLGLTFVSTFIVYWVARVKSYRAAIFIFSIASCSAAYISMATQGSETDPAVWILIYVVPSLIVVSTFLSSWAVVLLTSLNISALIAAGGSGTFATGEMIVHAALISMIGFLLFLFARFRNSLEQYRLDQVQMINLELEDLTGNLEQRVDDRTRQLEIANQKETSRVAQLQAIAKLSETIAQVQDLSKIFPEAVRLISSYFRFYHVGIFLVDEAREYAVLQAANSEGGKRMLARNHRLRLGTGMVGYAAQTGLPRIALDVGTDAVYFNNPDLPETRSEAALPMKSKEETIGILDVQSTKAQAFSNDDLQILTTLANQVAIAIDNARLLTETRTALEQVQAVYNEFTRSEWGRSISKAEQSGFRYHAGRIEILEKDINLPEIDAVVTHGKAVSGIVNGAEGTRSTIAVPVKLRGEIIGVIHVEASDPAKRWFEDEVSLVEAVAERAAFAMENARLFQDARRRAIKEQSISEATARISSAINIENILHATADELERVLGGSEVLIRLQGGE